jgi:hypothetical protein
LQKSNIRESTYKIIVDDLISWVIIYPCPELLGVYLGNQNEIFNSN